METTAYYLVVDLEATCDDQGAVPRDASEIIEIGAVKVDALTLLPVAEWQTFVRPVLHPRLTRFCTTLTSITQAQVDAAPRFLEVVKDLGRFAAGSLFCSWGNYDKNQLARDAERNGIKSPLGPRHWNLKEAFSAATGIPRRLGTGQALQRAGLAFAGTPHRGIDDARNIARLLPIITGKVVLS